MISLYPSQQAPLVNVSQVSGLGSLATVTPTGVEDGTKYLKDDLSWSNVDESEITGLGSLATITPTGSPDGDKFMGDDFSWQRVDANQVQNLQAYVLVRGLGS